MKTKQFKVSARIAILFATAISLSFIPDYSHLFFGDTFCLGNIGKNVCIEGWCNLHGNTYHWGYRHFLWALMGLSLAIVQIVGIVQIIDKD